MNLVDDMRRAMDALEIDPNPIVSIDVSWRLYHILIKHCRPPEETMHLGWMYGTPIHIKDGLPTGCRAHYKDGTTKDIPT